MALLSNLFFVYCATSIEDMIILSSLSQQTTGPIIIPIKLVVSIQTIIPSQLQLVQEGYPPQDHRYRPLPLPEDPPAQVQERIP